MKKQTQFPYPAHAHTVVLHYCCMMFLKSLSQMPKLSPTLCGYQYQIKPLIVS